MKLTVNEKRDIEAKYLEVKSGVRYWEDATVNGIEDEDGELIPCRSGDVWNPIIELETGRIINWEKGVVADIHYKSCDNNDFYLLDADRYIVKQIDGYVINMLSPKERGYGDYIIMDVDAGGFIENFKPDLTEFEKEE